LNARSRRFSVLRDSVHGDVYLTDEELTLLDTPEVQRLRGVKQLGTAYLVFPGATHTRFEHSIGTLHLTQRMIDAINLNFELDPRSCLGVSDEEARVIRIASLLHDVTHIPFGHNIEDQTGLVPRHDTPARYRELLGGDTVLARRLAELGVVRDVLAILTEDVGEGGRGSGGVPRYWCQVVSDTICSDLFDYLARDAYYTGLRLGVDSRLVNYFKIDRRTGNLFIDVAKRNLLREDILSEMVRMLEARYYFSERVYYHHAKVAAGALVSRAVELALVAGCVEERDLYGQTDDSLLALLEERAERADERTMERIRALIASFRGRRLLKRACVFPRYENQGAQEELVSRYFARGRHAERQALEERISSAVRRSAGRDVEVIVYCPAAHMQLKEVATHVRWPAHDEVRPLAAFGERVPRLADLERSYRDLWKFYVFAGTADPALLREIQRVSVKELAGATNVYRLDDGGRP